MPMYILYWILCGILGAAIMRGALYAAFYWKPVSFRIVGACKRFMREKVDNFFFKVKEDIPLASMVLQGEMEENLKKSAENELLQAIPEIQRSIALPLGIIGALIGFLAAFSQTILMW